MMPTHPPVVLQEGLDWPDWRRLWVGQHDGKVLAVAATAAASALLHADSSKDSSNNSSSSKFRQHGV